MVTFSPPTTRKGMVLGSFDIVLVYLASDDNKERNDEIEVEIVRMLNNTEVFRRFRMSYWEILMDI